MNELFLDDPLLNYLYEAIKTEYTYEYRGGCSKEYLIEFLKALGIPKHIRELAISNIYSLVKNKLYCSVWAIIKKTINYQLLYAEMQVIKKMQEYGLFNIEITNKQTNVIHVNFKRS